MSLQEKVAIVTGASSGIGRAIAVSLAAQGARVTLAARRGDRLELVKQQIKSRGGDALVVVTDLRDEQAILRLFEISQQHFHRLDILINSAGVGRMASLHNGDAADWREMWEVNVLGLTIATREALKHFNPTVGGHVVHVSSISGQRPPRTSAFYAATKFAVHALADALRHELTTMNSRSRVSCISPGFVNTEFFNTYFRGDQNKVREILTRHRMLAPEEVAFLVIQILELPDHVEIHDIIVRCHEEPS